MSISLTCQCGKPYTVPDEYAGRSVKCKKCGNVFKVETQEQIDFSSPLDEYGVVGGATSYEPEPPQNTQWDAASQQPSTYDAASAWVINQNTSASNSGRMRINFGKYLSLHPTAIAVEMIAIVIGVVAAIAVGHVAALIISGVGVYMLLSSIATLRGKFLNGDVNPAVVVSARPWRVAVYADMTKGGGTRPAIQILDAPLGKMTGGPPQVGQYLAAVCLYSDAPGDAWGDFNPSIVQCGVTDRGMIDRVMASISPGEWKALDRQLSRLPDRKPGLYKLWQGTENTLPGGAKALLARAVILVACAVPVIAIVAKVTRKLPASQQASSNTASADPAGERRRVTSTSTETPGETTPPLRKTSAVAAVTPPVKPAKKDNDLWGDVLGGKVTPDAKSPASVVQPATPPKPPVRPAGASAAATVTPDSTAAEPPAPESPAPAPTQVAPPSEPSPATVTPGRPSRTVPSARAPVDRTPPVPGVNKNVTFKAGQTVEVFHIGRWWSGRVVNVDRGQYAIAFDRMPDASARKFAVDQIRAVP